MRFVSDSLQFTGTDLGDRRSGTSRRNHNPESDDEESSTSDGDDDDYDLALLGPEEKEEALVQTAMARIQRAQLRGRNDVSLSKEELAALERRRQRMEEEAEKRERKKKKKQRVAVPLSHLDPVSRKKKSGQSPAELDSSSRRPSATDLANSQEPQVYPPMGYFPPPSGARSRPRSGTSSSQRPSSRAPDERGSSPFHYEYVQQASATGRHVSDSMARPRSGRGYPQDEGWMPNGNGLDPFQFQTAGPLRAAAHSPGSAAASRRYASGPSEVHSKRRDGTAPVSRSSLGNRRGGYNNETDEEDSDSQSTSDEQNSGARIREPTRSRESEIVVEVSPEPEPEPSPPKKKSSDVKRKAVPSRGGRRKKK